MSVDYLRSEDVYDLQVERVARGVCVGSAGQGVERLLGHATHASVAWMYGPAQLGFYAVTRSLAESVFGKPFLETMFRAFAGALQNAREPIR
jgi:hypothetical protein